VYDIFEVCPFLAINSPTKRCGKTRLLILVQSLVHDPLLASNISTASVYRTIEAFRPTLLVDEVDRFLKINQELIGVLNSGHTKHAAFVVRSVGEDYEPNRFSTWCPKVVAGIGDLPDTIADRSIEIPMRRKTPEEKVKFIRLSQLPKQFKSFREKILRWVTDNKVSIEKANPELPKSSNDRAIDNWMPLLQIAETIGGEWPDKARKLFGVCANGEEPDDGVSIELLKDIKGIFNGFHSDRISTNDLLDHLCKLEERPWSTYNRGKEISSRQIAKKLKPFNISSQTIRFESGSRKGYYRKDFDDAFNRYIPPPNDDISVTSDTSYKNNDIQDYNIRNKGENVTDKNSSNLFNNNGVTEVTGNNSQSENKLKYNNASEDDTKKFDEDVPF